MKGKLIQLLLSLLFWLSLLFLSGDLKKILEKLKQKLPEDEGTVSVDNIRLVDADGAQTLYFTVSNGTKDEICYSDDYDLFRMDGGDPVYIPITVSIRDDTADFLPAGETRELALILSQRYGRLPAGSYRIGKVLGALRTDVDFTVAND